MSSHVYVKGEDAGGRRQAVCARVCEEVWKTVSYLAFYGIVDRLIGISA